MGERAVGGAVQGGATPAEVLIRVNVDRDGQPYTHDAEGDPVELPSDVLDNLWTPVPGWLRAAVEAAVEEKKRRPAWMVATDDIARVQAERLAGLLAHPDQQEVTFDAD